MTEISTPTAIPGHHLEAGGNCQRHAYAVLALFGREVPPYWSSDLWEDEHFEHPSAPADLDLVLVNREHESFAAHVGVVLGGKVLHLCAEIGRPALWGWEEFAARERYREVIGFVRVPKTVRQAV